MSPDRRGSKRRSHPSRSFLSDPVRWQRVVDLFHAALERQVDERDAFLREACGADMALHGEVASLLASDRQESGAGWDHLGEELAAGWVRERETPTLVGHTLGRYEVVSRLGSGGMGEVYRASDRTLGRSVALKVLWPERLLEPGLRRRLEDEARAASSLNHPNIVTVYEIGHAETVDFIASEFVDGETLREAIDAGPLRVADLIDIALQIAAALSAAHGSGIVHRDIKPENVMLRRDRIVKLVDFGLAKIAPEDGAAATLATLTRAGAVRGTVCYMSPEQALSEPLDHRSDLFSFGVVLYEMATGRRPFDGVSDAARYDALLNTTAAPPTALRPELPPGLDLIVERALEKAPELRYQSAADLAADLKRLQRPITTSSSPARRTRAKRALRVWQLGAVAALAALGGVAAYTSLSPGSVESRVVRSVVPPPARAAFTLTGTLVPSVTLALSPDGRHLAFLAERSGERARLWIRALDSMEATALAGTEGATYPFWSPDGRSLAFFADGVLKRIEIDGGTPLTLVDKTDGRGGSWSREGFILFGSSEGPIHRVPAAGGAARAVTTLDVAGTETWHRFPQFLPDGRHFLFLARNAQNARTLFAGSVDDGALKTPILETNVKAAFSQPGYLLYVTEGTLMARRFDDRRLALAGQPVEIARRVATSSANDAAFAASDTGVLVYSERVSSPGQLAWFDRTGQRLGTLGPVDEFLGVRLSPDARTIAVTRVDLALNMPDIWMFDLDRTVFSRFTFDPWLDVSPVWSSDGSRVLFSSSRLGRLQIFHRAAGGGPVEQPLVRTGFSMFPDDATRDGRSVIYSTDSTSGRYDIELLRLSDMQTSSLVATRFNESQARLSPDGRWMAYCSDETGRDEVFVREFSGGTASVQVSSQGGSEPAWRGDGKELYFLSPDDRIMSVRMNLTGSRMEASVPANLFQIRTAGVRRPYLTHYAARSDGRQFLVNAATGDPTSPMVSVLANWTNLIGR